MLRNRVNFDKKSISKTQGYKNQSNNQRKYPDKKTNTQFRTQKVKSNENKIIQKSREEIAADLAFKNQSIPLLTIKGCKIRIYSFEKMLKLARGVLVNKDKIDGDKPEDLYGTVNDPRMGNVSTRIECAQCNRYDCPGHYSLLVLPKGFWILHPILIKEIISVLRCICKNCSRLLASVSAIEKEGILNLNYESRLKELAKLSKELVHCKQSNGKTIYKDENGEDIILCKNCGLQPVLETKNSQKDGTIYFRKRNANGKYDKSSPIYAYSNEQVFTMLNAISDEDAKILSFEDGSHPRDLVLRGILIMPELARPPTYANKPKPDPDPLTKKYATLISRKLSLDKEGDFHIPPEYDYNEIKSLSKNDEYRGKTKKRKKLEGLPAILEKINLLYNAYYQILVNKTDPRSKKKPGEKQNYKSIFDRLQGKDAIMRACLMGKRNNCSARTVASPEVNIDFGQLGIPEKWCSILKKPEMVNERNIERLQLMIRKRKIRDVIAAYTKREFSVYTIYNTYDLKIGDVVLRDLQKGDRAAFNRQPSLHKHSFMGVELVPMPRLTVGVHLCYTAPLNMDFDGDEGNCWFPQNLNVESELHHLINVQRNIMSGQQNRPIIGLVMNSVTGSYLLTDNNTRVDRFLFKECYDILPYKKYCQDLNERLEKYGVHPLSGKALFSMFLPPDFFYQKGNVIVMEGVLVSGRLNKTHIGNSHGSMIQEMIKKYGYKKVVKFLTSAPKVLNHWIFETGFTIGIKDCMINQDKKIEEKLRETNFDIKALRLDHEEPDSVKEVKEMNANSILDIAKSFGANLSEEIIKSTDNAIAIMSEPGAKTKGAIANFSQITSIVGQQYQLGRRFEYTLTNNSRCLPFFDRYDTDPVARGFIPDSFYKGISPVGLYFAHAACRENLTDTSLKTAVTGTIERLIIKAMENMILLYDGSVRSTHGYIYQICYNSGYDPSMLVNFENSMLDDKDVLFMNVKNEAKYLNFKNGWVDEETYNIIKNNKEELSIELLNYPVKKIKFVNFNKPIKNIDLSKCNRGYGELPRKLTKFEVSRMVGIRALQLAHNDKPKYDAGDEQDLIKIATKELKLGLLKSYILRKLPSGKSEIVEPTIDNIDFTVL